MMFVCIISIMMTNFVVKKKKINVLEIFKVSCIPGVLESWWQMFSNLQKIHVYLSFPVKLVKKFFLAAVINWFGGVSHRFFF